MTRDPRSHAAACRCGRMTLEIRGAPITHVICYCDSCRTAGCAFDATPGAPQTVDRDGGTDLLLYRKDRVSAVRNGYLLEEHRLTPASSTRRMVATCCDSPMLLEVVNGHWLSIYRRRVPGDVGPVDMRVMTGDRRDDATLPADVPGYRTHSPRLMLKLLAAWAGMGFRKPKVAW